MRLQSIFEFIDEEDARFLGCLALQSCDEQPCRSDSKRPQWHAVLAVDGDRPPAERNRMRVQHRF